MKRKEFLKQLGLITGGVTLSVEGMAAQAFSYTPFGLNLSGTNGKVLVIIQLNGGNDGLNTVVPIEDANYYNKRPSVAIAKNEALSLNSLAGLNPGMGSMKNLYEDNKVCLLQNVGYASPNQSHFRSTDIWLSASDSAQVLTEGWAARYLTTSFPDYPAQIPDQPMAVQLGSVESMLLISKFGSMGTVFDAPSTFYQLVNGSTADNDPPPATLAGDELKFLKQVASQSIQYAGVIKTSADKGKNVITYPNTGLARQLAIVAKLISGGATTPIYLTSIGGFDTHANQLGAHQNLLKQVSDAIAAFQMDIDRQGLGKKVALMTFSEFGRRVNQNATNGTDHGTSAPLFVVGAGVRGGILGGNPDLNYLDNNGNLQFKIDYRQIYATVLRDHLGLSQPDAKGILLKDFDKLPIFKASAEQFATELAFLLQQNYPNPVQDFTTIRYEVNKTQLIRLNLMDMAGREVSVLQEGYADAGTYTYSLDARNLSNGLYLISMTGEGNRQTIKMVVGK